GKRIVVVGDVMLDAFEWGLARELSQVPARAQGVQMAQWPGAGALAEIRRPAAATVAAKERATSLALLPRASLRRPGKRAGHGRRRGITTSGMGRGKFSVVAGQFGVECGDSSPLWFGLFLVLLSGGVWVRRRGRPGRRQQKQKRQSIAA